MLIKLNIVLPTIHIVTYVRCEVQPATIISVIPFNKNLEWFLAMTREWASGHTILPSEF